MNAKALTLQHEPLQTSEIVGSSRLPAFVHICFFMCIKVKKKKKKPVLDQTSDTFYADDTTRVKGRGRQIAHCCYQSQPTPLAPHRGPCSWTHGNPNMTRTPLPETCARGPVSVHIVSFVKLVHSLWPASFHPAHWCIFKFPSWACFANWWLYFAPHWYPLIITDHYVYLIKFFFLTPQPQKKKNIPRVRAAVD